MPTDFWGNLIFSLVPTVVVGLIFWFVIRSIIRADRNERKVYAKIEAEERAKLAAQPDEPPIAASSARRRVSTSRGRNRTFGSSGAGSGDPSYPSTAPKRPSGSSPRDHLVLPLLAERDDLVVAAADEVPPHDDLLAERLAADQQRAQRLDPRPRSAADPARSARRRGDRPGS